MITQKLFAAWKMDFENLRHYFKNAQRSTHGEDSLEVDLGWGGKREHAEMANEARCDGVATATGRRTRRTYRHIFDVL